MTARIVKKIFGLCMASVEDETP